jgi:hypothetical protein
MFGVVSGISITLPASSQWFRPEANSIAIYGPPVIDKRSMALLVEKKAFFVENASGTVRGWAVADALKHRWHVIL